MKGKSMEVFGIWYENIICYSNKIQIHIQPWELEIQKTKKEFPMYYEYKQMPRKTMVLWDKKCGQVETADTKGII